MPRQSHVYRFVATDAGTYWYHSHQVSDDEVRRGLFGALVVLPAAPLAAAVDTVVAVHTYHGRRTVNGHAGTSPLAAKPGELVRARLINTDAGPIRAWVAGVDYRVVAVDGRDVSAPTPVGNAAVLLTAGGRIDVGSFSHHGHAAGAPALTRSTSMPRSRGSRRARAPTRSCRAR